MYRQKTHYTLCYTELPESGGQPVLIVELTLGTFDNERTITNDTKSDITAGAIRLRKIYICFYYE